jgi:hypothetical protein
VTVRESEWSDEDRGYLLALTAEEADKCPGCGQPLDECRDKVTARTWEVVQETCWACMPLQAVMQDAAKVKDPPRGRYYGVRRTS